MNPFSLPTPVPNLPYGMSSGDEEPYPTDATEPDEDDEDDEEASMDEEDEDGDSEEVHAAFQAMFRRWDGIAARRQREREGRAA